MLRLVDALTRVALAAFEALERHARATNRSARLIDSLRARARF